MSAKRQYHEIAGQFRRWTGQEGAGGDVFKNLVASLGAEGALAGSLDRHAAEASAAFAEFGRFLSDELGPRGRDREAVGRDEYALCSRYFLGATVDLDETYAWGWAELKRLDDEMVETADRIVPGGTVDEAVAALDGDPARSIDGRERFRDWMQELADRTVAEMADVHFDIPGADPHDRVPARPDQRRRHLLHPSQRGLQPARADVVVGARRHRHLLHLARDDDGLPRGRSRPPPPVRADDVPRRAAQPLAAPDVLGQRPRRGLGPVLRAADGRPRLPRRPGRQDGHARRSVRSARPG